MFCCQMALYLFCIFFFPLSCNPQYKTLFTFNTEDNITIQVDKNPHYIWGRTLPKYRPDKGKPDTRTHIINCPPARVHAHLYTKSTPVRRQCQLMFARLLQQVRCVWKQRGDDETVTFTWVLSLGTLFECHKLGTFTPLRCQDKYCAFDSPTFSSSLLLLKDIIDKTWLLPFVEMLCSLDKWNKSP